MSKFKVGDKVVEISTGDVGVVTEHGVYCNVLWECLRDHLRLPERSLEHYQEPFTKLTKQDLQFLETVLKERIIETSDDLEWNRDAASACWEFCDGTKETSSNFKLFSDYNTNAKQSRKKLKKLAELQAKVKRMKG